MFNRLIVAVVDDDPHIHEDLSEFYANSQLVEIKHHFTDPAEFVKTLHALEFDLCLLDINMPRMDGLSVAQAIGNKPVVFLTANLERLSEALKLGPIDVVTKPFTKQRLDAAFERAVKLIADRIEHAVFNVAESNRKLNIKLRDILFVAVDDVDPRNKLIHLKGCTKYTLMDYSFIELKAMAQHLVQVNRRNMVSVDCIHSIGHDTVILNSVCKDMPAEVTLSSIYKAEVSKRIFFK